MHLAVDDTKHLQAAGRKGGLVRAASLSPGRRSAIASAAARARWALIPFAGATDEGPLPVARFNVGLKVDQPRPGSILKEKGARIPPDQAISEFYKLRAGQVGERAADATILRCEGRFEGMAQRSLTCEVAFLPTPNEKSRSAFRKNMVGLAESLCGRLGQEEVWLWFGPRLIRANAPGEEAPKAKTRAGRPIR